MIQEQAHVYISQSRTDVAVHLRVVLGVVLGSCGVKFNHGNRHVRMHSVMLHAHSSKDSKCRHSSMDSC